MCRVSEDMWIKLRGKQKRKLEKALQEPTGEMLGL